MRRSKEDLAKETADWVSKFDSKQSLIVKNLGENYKRLMAKLSPKKILLAKCTKPALVQTAQSTHTVITSNPTNVINFGV